MKYRSINTIFASIGRDIHQYSISDGEVIEWCGRALEEIQSPNVYETDVAFVEVADYKCDLPKHLHVILQIAKNNLWSGTGVTAEEVLTDPTIEIGDTPVALDQNGLPLNAYDLAYYRPYFSLEGEYNILGNSSEVFSKFSPVRLANHTFFHSLVAQEEGFEDLYSASRDEYTIVEDVLKFSFVEGQVAIAYLKQKLDCDGYPMIPDSNSSVTAIEKYIKYKLREIDFEQGRQGSEMRLQKAESDWHWYCRQAKNENMLPQTIDEWENLMQQRSYLLPQTNRYYGFFGKLATKENRNLPDYGVTKNPDSYGRI